MNVNDPNQPQPNRDYLISNLSDLSDLMPAPIPEPTEPKSPAHEPKQDTETPIASENLPAKTTTPSENLPPKITTPNALSSTSNPQPQITATYPFEKEEHPQYFVGLPHPQTHKNRPKTQESIIQFKRDWYEFPLEKLVAKYEASVVTMRAWAKRWGFKRSPIYDPRKQGQFGAEGGRPTKAMKKLRAEVQESAQEVTAAVRDKQEFQDDIEIQKLLADLQVAMHKTNTPQDIYQAQLLVVKLQGLASVKGSKTFADVVDTMARLTDKILLTRRIEAETPLPQSQQYVFEQALGFWIADAQSVLDQKEFAYFETMILEIARRLALRDGVVLPTKPVGQVRQVLSPTVIDATVTNG